MALVGSAPVVFDNAALQQLLHSPTGPVMRHMAELGRKTQERTRGSLKPGFPHDFLAPSIVLRYVDSPTGPEVWIGSNRVRTEPHAIVGNPLLAFEWKKIGKFVIVRSVRHPGSNFAKYLGTKLWESLTAVMGSRK